MNLALARFWPDPRVVELYRSNARSPIPYPRVRLRLPVRYRVEGDVVWHASTTENISRSGALIRAETPMPLAARVHLVLRIPPRVLAAAPSEVVSIGMVCRHGKSSVGHDVVGIRFDVVAVEALDAVMARLTS